jgi:hypothetical protein
MKQMQMNGQHESIQNLTSILLQDQEEEEEEDKYVGQNSE